MRSIKINKHSRSSWSLKISIAWFQMYQWVAWFHKNLTKSKLEIHLNTFVARNRDFPSILPVRLWITFALFIGYPAQIFKCNDRSDDKCITTKFDWCCYIICPLTMIVAIGAVIHLISRWSQQTRSFFHWPSTADLDSWLDHVKLLDVD